MKSKYSSERAFRDYALRRLKEEFPECFIESIQQRSISGSPDNLLCVNGWFVALEFKKSAKSPISMLQKHKIQKIIKAGGLGFITFPENFENVLYEIRKTCR